MTRRDAMKQGLHDRVLYRAICRRVRIQHGDRMARNTRLLRRVLSDLVAAVQRGDT